MLGLTLGEAKTIAAIAVVVLLVLAVVASWIMKEVVQKVVAVAVLGVLALIVWSQRTNLQSCANDIAAEQTFTEGDAAVDPTCEFFGRDVRVPLGRSS